VQPADNISAGLREPNIIVFVDEDTNGFAPGVQLPFGESIVGHVKAGYSIRSIFCEEDLSYISTTRDADLLDY
jgi:hypothetical protein